MKKPIAIISIFLILCNTSLSGLKIVESDSLIEITNDGNIVLAYHKAIMPPPDGQPKIFERSGFIHPIKTPSGGVVTGIHPSDHIHHGPMARLGGNLSLRT